MSIIPQFSYQYKQIISPQSTNAKVSIQLIDSNTNKPVNGNDITIFFDENLNGIVTHREVTIPGQSIVIYNGPFHSSTFFSSWTFTGQSDVPDPAPPVNACDLHINYIKIDNAESFPNAHDAQITVDAFSSYGPIMYSLDGINYQSSPTFDGLSGGFKKVNVTDTNSSGCGDQMAVQIPILSNLLTRDPSATLNGGNISRWNAAFNPVVFTYQRKDFEATDVRLDTLTGNAEVYINGTLTGLNVSDDVYVNSGNYIGLYKVLSYSVNRGAMVINTPYTGSAEGFVNINALRPYYKMITEITYLDPIINMFKKITSINRPNSSGLIKADISSFLQSLVKAKDDSDYSVINFRDTNLSASYQIKYAEQWDDIAGNTLTSTYITVADPFYIIYAAKQLGETYGGNMAAYVPFKSVIDASQRARWITDFTEPAYSNGYPFDIGFIYSDDMVGLQLYCDLTFLDINRQPMVGGPEANYLLNDDNTWLLNQDSGRLVIASQTSSNIPIPEQLGLNRLLINTDFASDVHYFTLALKYDAEGITHTVTQTQTIRIDNAVDDNSVYLRWIGLNGAWNYYRFVFNQEISLDVQNATIIKNYVFDWENQDGIEEVIGKSASQKMKVMAEDLPVNDIKGLQSIKYSPKVQMLVNKNPVKWQTIVINSATFSEYETRNGQAPFSITFNMPSINIQTQ